MFNKLTSSEGGRGLLLISPPFFYALLLMAFPLGGDHPVQFLDPEFHGCRHDIHAEQLSPDHRPADLWRAAATLAVRVGSGDKVAKLEVWQSEGVRRVSSTSGGDHAILGVGGAEKGCDD